MSVPRRLAVLALAGGLLAGCADMQLGKGKKEVVLKDFAEGRVVQVNVTDRLTGAKEMLFLSMPQKSLFLEGYIQGIVTDYDDNPIQGVVVRAQAEGEQKVIQKGEAAFQTSSFDAGVSDTNGIYRIRFTLPIIKNKVDIRGKLLYNPGWEQEKLNLGKAYRPQVDETPFRMYFDMKEGMLLFAEGIRKIVVKPEYSKEGAKGRQLPGSEAPAAEKPPETEKGSAEDPFKAFFQ